MTDHERAMYESAIRAKETVIRELIAENRRLKRRVAELIQCQIAEMQDRSRMVEAEHAVCRN